MRARKYKLVFEEEITKDHPVAFHFVPEPNDECVTGLLLSEGLSFSFAINNGTNLVLNREIASSDPSIAPDKRLIDLDIPLDGTALEGVVKLSEDSPIDEITGRIYFMINQKG